MTGLRFSGPGLASCSGARARAGALAAGWTLLLLSASFAAVRPSGWRGRAEEQRSTMGVLIEAVRGLGSALGFACTTPHGGAVWRRVIVAMLVAVQTRAVCVEAHEFCLRYLSSSAFEPLSVGPSFC